MEAFKKVPTSHQTPSSHVRVTETLISQGFFRKISSRPRHVKIFAYIVLCKEKFGDGEEYRFCWSYEVGSPDEPDLFYFDTTKGNLRLKFYEHNNKVGDIVMAYSEKEDKLAIV